MFKYNNLKRLFLKLKKIKLIFELYISLYKNINWFIRYFKTWRNQLLNKLPNVQQNYQNAKNSIKKDIETARITQDGIIFSYLAAQRKGINYDIRKQSYQNVNTINFQDMQKFNNQYLANKFYTYCVLASTKKVSETNLAKYGEVQKLSLEEIFGY